MKKILNIILFFLFIITGKTSSAQEKIIVGYLPDYRFKVSNTIDFCKMTHINICFANPDKQGNFSLSDTLPEVMDYIRSKNPEIKIFVSLAGGALSKEESIIWKNFIDQAKNRSILIKKIIQFIDQHQFDGVDIDLEWRNVTRGYSPFIIELKKALPKDMMLTAALPGTFRYSNITEEALKTFDLINLMAYDEKGSWAPNNPGQHSSYLFAQKSIHFWRDSLGVAQNKLTLGLPFYAYDFTNPRKTKSFTIAEIIRDNIDNVNHDSKGLIYYNGKPTIEKKVKLASKDMNLAGVMIWELAQDTFGDVSMLNTIHKQFESLEIQTTDQYCGLNEDQILEVQNKAFKKEINIAIDEKKLIIISPQISQLKIEILNKKAKPKKMKIIQEGNKYSYDLNKLKKGEYILKISKAEQSILKKIVLK